MSIAKPCRDCLAAGWLACGLAGWLAAGRATLESRTIGKKKQNSSKKNTSFESETSEKTQKAKLRTDVLRASPNLGGTAWLLAGWLAGWLLSQPASSQAVPARFGDALSTSVLSCDFLVFFVLFVYNRFFGLLLYFFGFA